MKYKITVNGFTTDYVATKKAAPAVVAERARELGLTQRSRFTWEDDKGGAYVFAVVLS